MIVSFREDFVEYPTLRFTMGSDDRVGDPNDDEGPSRQVSVGRFFVSSTPITVAEFSRFVEETGFVTVAEEQGSGFVGSFPEHELVPDASWRRPRGAEHSAPSRDAWVTQVAWSDALEFSNWCGMSLLSEAQWERVAPSLGSELFPPLGTYWEWCNDFYDPTFHRDEQRVNPVGPHHGTHRVARGGGVRLTQRAALLPDLGAEDLTFRVCHHERTATVC